MENFREFTTKNVSYVCLPPRNRSQIFRGGVHTQQCDRQFLRPTPTDFGAEARPTLLKVLRAGLRTQHHHRRHRGN
jgi:hypothetical protein